MKTKELAKGAIAIGAILLVLAADMLAVSKITTSDVYKAVAAMAIAVGAIAGSLAILSMIKTEDLKKAGIALGLMLLTLAVDFVAISTMSDSKVLGTVIAMIAGIVVIAGSLYILSEQPWDSLLAAAGALSMVLTAMAVSIAILSAITVDLTTLAAVGLGILAVVGVALSLKILAGEDWESLLAAGEAISLVLLAMSASLLVCSVVGYLAPGAIAGIALLDLFILNFLGVLYVLGELTKGEEVKELLNGGLETLLMIADAIGNFLGNIVGSFLENLASRLPALGDNLALFMEKATPFFDGVKNISQESMRGIKALAETLLILTASDLINGISSFFTGKTTSLADFGDELVAFAPKIKDFAGIVDGINPESVKGAGAAAEIMAVTANKLPKAGGLADAIFGETMSLSDFGKELVKFGPDLVKFAEMVQDVEKKHVEGAAAAAELMAELANKLPKSGGLADAIFGEKLSLSDFGKELVKFGPDLKQFADDVKDVEKKHVKGAAAAAELMAKLADGLPNSGGLAGVIFGENDLSDFGEELVKFGPNIAQFADDVKDVEKDSVEGTASVVEMMSKLANDLPNSGGVAGFFAGNNDLDDFGEMIASLGESIADYYESIEDIKVPKLVSVTNVIETFANVANILEDINLTIFPDFTDNLKKVSTNAISEFVDTFSGSDKKIKSAIKKLKDNLITQIKNVESEISKSFKSQGEKILNSFTDGMDGKKDSLNQSVKSISSDIVNTFNSALSYTGFKILGENITLGLINGMKSKKDELVKTAKELAEAAEAATRKALDEHSPSRVTHKLGEYFSIGLANGIISKIKSVEESSTLLANNSVDILQEAIYKALDMMDEEMEGDFVITPVLDLSNVENGVKAISSLFGTRELNLATTYGNALSVSSSFDKRLKDLEREVKENKKTTPVNNFNYTQNNYSPKALSRIDIYRNTRNQLSSLKGAMK